MCATLLARWGCHAWTAARSISLFQNGLAVEKWEMWDVACMQVMRKCLVRFLGGSLHILMASGALSTTEKFAQKPAEGPSKAWYKRMPALSMDCSLFWRTWIFGFALPQKCLLLILPSGWHVFFLRKDWDRKQKIPKWVYRHLGCPSRANIAAGNPWLETNRENQKHLQMAGPFNQKSRQSLPVYFRYFVSWDISKWWIKKSLPKPNKNTCSVSWSSRAILV